VDANHSQLTTITLHKVHSSPAIYDTNFVPLLFTVLAPIFINKLQNSQILHVASNSGL